MKTTAFLLLFAIGLGFLHVEAANARPDTRRMTCTAAQALVQQSGAIVMTTGRYTYDRIVTGRRFCHYDEEIHPVTAPTLDNPKCYIGYICRPESSLFDDGFFRFRRF